MEILEKAEKSKAELDALRPLDSEAEGRIMQKFRLDWNYHSNNIEGNSLTYGETKALILFGITAQGKPLKDHFEITGHNDAINWVLDLVKGETELTEVFIRELHTLLLKESSYKEAQTKEGKPTRRKIEIGKYKTQPNHVVTVTGETFYFASPEETPAKMQELVEWFRNEKTKTDVNPIILAALFHYRFIRIHPFDDGNGRIARILMNFILMRFGYPPVIIKTEDKENYYAVLRLADADQLEPFIEYIATNLVRSLEIMIRGAKGEEIEEPEDLDKEIILLEKEIRGVGKRIRKRRSRDVVNSVFENSISRFANKFFQQYRIFDDFYIENHAYIHINSSPVIGEYSNATHYAKEALERLTDDSVSEIKVFYQNTGFSQYGLGDFQYETGFIFRFELARFQIISHNLGILFTKLYDETLSDEEIAKMIGNEKRKHSKIIKKKLEEYKSVEG